MTSSSGRMSNFTKRASMGAGRPSSRDQDREEIWKPMLDSISSGKRLPEKSILVLGGTPEMQREFLDSVSTDGVNNRRPLDRAKKPPIANQFALGYTYQDVLDADHEDTLARLSLYLLADPSPSFTPLIKPYLNPRTLPHLLVVILLDWNQPWLWVRQLRDWIRVLRSLILSLDDDSKEVLEEHIKTVLDKGRGLDAADPSGNNALDSVRIPFGPGEMDEPLGIPLCVVCQNADKIEALEKDRGWRGEELDFIQQYMRTILLKHGASLVYTMASAPGPLQNLIHSHLGIRSLVKQEEVNPQATQEYRDKILIPPYWDAWSRIRLAGNGLFDFEGISGKWSVDIEIPAHIQAAANGDTAGVGSAPNGEEAGQQGEEPSATSIYEETIRNPEEHSSITNILSKQANGVEVASKDTQKFLAEQLCTLEALRHEDENDQKLKAARKVEDTAYRGWSHDDVGGVVEEHIGPVQFNMGGIQVNADEMVKRLQDREAKRAESPEVPASPTSHGQDPKMDNEKLASFFAGLMNKSSNVASSNSRGGT